MAAAQVYHSQGFTPYDVEELRALNFVRRSILQNMQRIGELEERVRELEQEVDTLMPLKWRCEDQKNQLKALQLELRALRDQGSNAQNLCSNSDHNGEDVEFDIESRSDNPNVKDEFMNSTRPEDPSTSTSHSNQLFGNLRQTHGSGPEQPPSTFEPQATTSSSLQVSDNFEASDNLPASDNLKAFDNLPTSDNLHQRHGISSKQSPATFKPQSTTSSGLQASDYLQQACGSSLELFHNLERRDGSFPDVSAPREGAPRGGGFQQPPTIPPGQWRGRTDTSPRRPEPAPFTRVYLNRPSETQSEVAAEGAGAGYVVVHKCGVCGRDFGAKSWLQRHMRKHTGEKPFACPLCGSRFAERGTLKRHMLARHEAEGAGAPDSEGHA